jgi:hypothetical protein
MYVVENPLLPELSSIVREMHSRRFEIAEFLVKDFASRATIDIRDAILLNDIAGINLLYAGRAGQAPDQDIGANIAKLFGEFKENYKKGVFKEPNVYVETVYRNNKEKDLTEFDAYDLLPYRRLGVYAIPALIDIIRRENSPTAFASLLCIMGDRDAYGTFLMHPRSGFSNTTAKIEHAKDLLKQHHPRWKERTEVGRHISESLR